MTENYNSPGSPYWCCKAFFILGIPKTHQFWLSKELPYPQDAIPKTVALKNPGHIISHVGKHNFLLSSGQFCHYPLRATHAKYGKFAYSSSLQVYSSSAFGFSVPTGQYTLEQYSPDSSLALSDNDGETWSLRLKPLDSHIEEHGGFPVLVSKWTPWYDVKVETYLIPPVEPYPNWHLRAHRVTTGRNLLTTEGGFAVYGQDENHRHLAILENGKGITVSRSRSIVISSAGASGISSLEIDGGKKRDAEVMRADSNSNIMCSRTVIPILQSSLSAGDDVWFVCAVLGIPCESNEQLSENDLQSLEIEPIIPNWLRTKILE
ncbi:hypothetical protein HK096_009489 [Nowakowskiella sp. JEL0078]|nr:hypothetical protein HK096_009489 [Nowakowskiella sp. JEL0078]